MQHDWSGGFQGDLKLYRIESVMGGPGCYAFVPNANPVEAAKAESLVLPMGFFSGSNEAKLKFPNSNQQNQEIERLEGSQWQV